MSPAAHADSLSQSLLELGNARAEESKKDELARSPGRQ
jgi:hypothetical protein